MGLLDRVGRVVRAQVTHWVNQAEDPERILEQTVQDMQADVVELRQAVAQAVATLKRTERQLVQAETQAAEWQRRAFMAGENRQDALARDALTKRQHYIAAANTYNEQIQQQRQLIGQLKQNMRLLDGQLSEAKTKKDLYIARARSAAATNRMNELLERTNPSGAGAVFERVEDKILQMEAQAELAAERQADPLNDRFDQLEAEAMVQGDYQQLQQSSSTSSAPARSRPTSLPKTQPDLPQLPSPPSSSYPQQSPLTKGQNPQLPPWSS